MMPNSKDSKFKISKVEKLPNAEALITGEISLPFLVELRPKALKHLNEHVKVDGFRPGKIPEDILVKNIGEMRILEETAEMALAQEFNNIIKEAKLSSLGRPEISITKLAPGIPLEFRIKVYLEPEFKLPDYKKIAKNVKSEKPDTTNLDKEVADTVKELEKRKIKADLKDGEKLEDKVRENILKEKEYREIEKRRLKILEELVKAFEVELPKILVDNELEKMLAQFKGDVEQVGLKWADYLKQIKKSEEQVKSEWQDKAVDRVKAELLMARIAEEEKIQPDEKLVEHESKHLQEHYPDADPIRIKFYVYSQLLNQKVLEFLENC